MDECREDPRNFQKYDNSIVKTSNHIDQHPRKSPRHPHINECANNISNMYKCKKCDFETNQKVSLKFHFNLNHKSQNPENQNQPIIIMKQCGFCDFQTYSVLLLLKHNLNCDKRDNLLIYDSEDETVHLSWLECGQCSAKTKDEASLRQHIKNEHSTNFKLFQCENCPFKSKHKHNFLKHVQNKHTNRERFESTNCFKCEKCAFKTKIEIYFQIHVKSHKRDSSKITWHPCDKCDFKTKWKAILNEHRALLHREPIKRVWFNCKKCEYKTERKARLQQHIKIAHRVTVLEIVKVWFNCNKCEYKAETEAHLKQHMENVHRANVREIVSQNGDVVSFLLEASKTKNLTHDERYFLKQLERPTPALKNLVNVNANSSNRKFCTSWYQKCKWLTGSEVRSKLYCWTCLLFNPPSSKSPWHTTGFDNMKSLSRSVERHGISKDHTYSSLKYKLFGANNQNSLDSDSVIKHNEKVKENRDILRRLIDMTIYLAPFECHTRCHINEKDDLQNQGSFRELAELLSSYDSKFEEFLKSSSVFNGISTNDLIDSINYVVLETIESQISNSVCFSWQIDETTVACEPRLSVVVRYTHEGDTVERFLGFFDVVAGRTADSLFNFLSLRFDKFNLKDKLIGQSYDGASVISSDLNELQSRIKMIAPQAFYTHCHAHKIDLILQDSVSSIQECKIFFATVSAISDFFSKSTKRTKVFDNACKRRGPRNAQTNWNIKSCVVNTILTYREELLETFEEIIESSDFAKDLTSIRESASYIDFLNDFDTLFLLNVFTKIFEQTDLIDSIIQSQSDILYSKFQIENLLDKIKFFKKEEPQFREIYDNTVKVLGVPPERRKSNLDSDVSLRYKRLCYELLDLIIAQIQARFADFDKLQIFELLNSDKFASFAKYFPFDLLNLLVKYYPKLFNKDKLETELKILYSDVTILGESTKLKDMLKFITANSLSDVVPELYKLLSSFLSLSATSSAVEGFSAFERIKNYARNTRFSNLSLIAIEREMVKSLRKSPNFFDRVIDNFAQNENGGIELIYKNL